MVHEELQLLYKYVECRGIIGKCVEILMNFTALDVVFVQYINKFLIFIKKIFIKNLQSYINMILY